METFRDITSTTDDISDIPLIYNKIGTGWALDPPHLHRWRPVKGMDLACGISQWKE